MIRTSSRLRPRLAWPWHSFKRNGHRALRAAATVCLLLLLAVELRRGFALWHQSHTHTRTFLGAVALLISGIVLMMWMLRTKGGP